MAQIRWSYHGPITVLTDNGIRVEARGRIGRPAMAPAGYSGWYAEVFPLPGHAQTMDTDTLRDGVTVLVPGGGQARANSALPVIAAAGRGAGYRWLISDPSTDLTLPPQEPARRISAWLGWQRDCLTAWRRP